MPKELHSTTGQCQQAIAERSAKLAMPLCPPGHAWLRTSSPSCDRARSQSHLYRGLDVQIGHLLLRQASQAPALIISLERHQSPSFLLRSSYRVILDHIFSLPSPVPSSRAMLSLDSGDCEATGGHSVNFRVTSISSL